MPFRATNPLLKRLLKPLVVPLPWLLKRPLLQHFFGYRLSPTARIGLAWVFPDQLWMASKARIDHLTVAVNLDLLAMGYQSSIGRSNWITGFPTGTTSPHFAHQPERRAELHLGDHAAITKHHHIDCTNNVCIGPYTTIAGYHTQLLTHSIDYQRNRQHSEPITIGAYCFVGTSCVILGGAVLPDHCVLGAVSLLNKPHTQTWSLYAGQPAQRLKPIPVDAAYFGRTIGFVV